MQQARPTVATLCIASLTVCVTTEALSPDSFEAFYQHAGLYSEHSKRKVGHEADALSSKAFKNYEMAVQIKPYATYYSSLFMCLADELSSSDYHEALAEYFDRLWEQGTRAVAARQGTKQLFSRAGEVLEAALKARPDIYEPASVCILTFQFTVFRIL